MDGEWLTVEEVAARLGLHPSSVHKLINEGRLQARKIYGARTQKARLNLISPDEVERYRSEHLGKGAWQRRRDPDYQPSPSAKYQRERRARLKADWQHKNLVEPTQQPADAPDKENER